MNLAESLLCGFYAYGLEKASAIWQGIILHCVKEV